jgi:hypothetical protein
MAKKLHQLIANEGDTNSAYDRIKAETFGVFKDHSRLDGFTRTYTPKDAEGQGLPDERKEIVTTVRQRLDWTERFLTELLDHELKRDRTNTTAKADLVVDGKTIAENVPATYLLTLERRLKEIRAVYDAIPTLDMAHPWKAREAGSDVMQYGPVEQVRTEKQTIPLVLHPGTDKHPPQVDKIIKDVVIGTWNRVEFSGRITPDRKAQYLERVDKFIKAVRDARMDANNATVIDDAIGKQVFEYLNG